MLCEPFIKKDEDKFCTWISYRRFCTQPIDHKLIAERTAHEISKPQLTGLSEPSLRELNLRRHK
ncbi:unnamed protein product [Debaryomyces tyrocola]|nr:unnamed protein product [Debaryomyces tyrocola]